MEKILQAEAAIQISKPAAEVFEAIVNPEKMAGYFIEQGSGRLEEGKEVIWRFPEFDIDCPVKVAKVTTNRYVSYYWEGARDNQLLVEINLEPIKDDSFTVVRITEKGMDNNEEGINWLKGNTEGWANFLACLKAYLEYSINLRKGAFDFRSPYSKG